MKRHLNYGERHTEAEALGLLMSEPQVRECVVCGKPLKGPTRTGKCGRCAAMEPVKVSQAANAQTLEKGPEWVAPDLSGALRSQTPTGIVEEREQRA